MQIPPSKWGVSCDRQGEIAAIPSDQRVEIGFCTPRANISYPVAFRGGSPAFRVAGRRGGMAGIGFRRGPDHKAGGASMARVMAYAAAS